jgi:hypothetical protein
MVFLGVRGNGTLFGYNQLRRNMNEAEYHRVLQHNALPDLRDGNGGDLERLVWQQDGATPHCSNANMAYLARAFGGRLISRKSEQHGGRDWAARSPDLNPLDFGIWGILKARVFTPRPRTLMELRTRIDQQVAELGNDRQLLQRVVASLLRRCHEVIAADGGYIEN